MTMVAAELISLGLASGALALGYAARGVWIAAALIVVAGGAWWIGRRRFAARLLPLAPIGLIAFSAAAAIGIWIGADAGWMLIGATAALAAWDVEHFAQRAHLATRAESRDALTHWHFRWLILVTGASLALGWLGLSLQVELGFGPALLLGAIALVALSAMMGFQRRDGESS